MQENNYKGYPIIGTENPIGDAAILNARASKIKVAEFEGLGTAISIEGIDPGRNPKVMGRFIDEGSQLDGYWWIMVSGGGQINIIVPPDKLLIGR